MTLTPQLNLSSIKTGSPKLAHIHAQAVDNRLGRVTVLSVFRKLFFSMFSFAFIHIPFLHQTTLTSQTLNASRRLSSA